MPASHRRRRPTFDDMNLSSGKRARLHRMMYQSGPANGTLMLLPLDQGLEHGPIDFFDNPDAIDPDWTLRLAVAGRFSGVVLHVGLAEKYHKPYAGRVPLVLKINGKTNIPPDDDAFASLTASVEDAVRLGADAVGYTLYVGSTAQDMDIHQAHEVRRECEKYGMPFVVWAYPRGSAIRAKGGPESLYAIDYAARVAAEIGADIVELSEPVWDDARAVLQPKPYTTMHLDAFSAFQTVIASAGRTLVLVGGGGRADDATVLHKAKVALDAGCVGVNFGRNLWQRRWDDALQMSASLHALMDAYGD